MLYLADEDGHAEVLEASSVADPAVLHPKVVHGEELFPEPFGPEEVGVAFEGANDVVGVDLRENPLLLAPHAGTVRPRRPPHARVEERAPVRAVEPRECLHVVLHVEEPAGAAPVHDLVQAVPFLGVEPRVEGNVASREAMAVAGAAAASLVLDILVGGAAVLIRRRCRRVRVCVGDGREGIVCG